MKKLELFNIFLQTFPELNTKRLDQYLDFCLSRENAEKQKGFHLHHILPRSHFPEYIKDENYMCYLSLREHIFAHALLARATKSAKMKLAYVMLKGITTSDSFGTYYDKDGNKLFLTVEEAKHKNLKHICSGKKTVWNPNIDKHIQVDIDNNEYESSNKGYSTFYLDPKTNKPIRIKVDLAKQLNLKLINNGMKVVKDISSDKFLWVSCDDPQYKDYPAVNAGYTLYIDENDSYIRTTVEEANKLGLTHSAKNKKVVFDKKENKYVRKNISDVTSEDEFVLKKGYAAYIDSNNNIKYMSVEEANEKNLNHVNKGKKTVKNPNTGEYVHVDINSNEAKEWEPLSKGRMKNKSVFIDKDTMQTVVLDIRDQQIDWSRYEQVSKNKFMAKDKFGNKFYISKNDERYLSGELCHISKGTTWEQQQVTCPHCGKVGKASGMKRWHFDNCKHKV